MRSKSRHKRKRDVQSQPIECVCVLDTGQNLQQQSQSTANRTHHARAEWNGINSIGITSNEKRMNENQVVYTQPIHALSCASTRTLITMCEPTNRYNCIVVSAKHSLTHFADDKNISEISPESISLKTAPTNCTMACALVAHRIFILAVFLYLVRIVLVAFWWWLLLGRRPLLKAARPEKGAECVNCCICGPRPENCMRILNGCYCWQAP